MTELILARMQFASTTIFHFLFVPLSIGLAFIVAIMQTMYYFTKKDMYLKMTEFWGKFFLINFAVGVVTGIIQEFQFGMNWSEYSRFMGDIFGVPLAIEALLAFFIESTFIGVWIFGKGRLPKGLHLASIWLVAIGTVLSAFWILSANSFMQNPLGYELEGGRAIMNDVFAVLTNPKLLVAFPHTIFAALATGGFFIAGVSAWKLLKKKDITFFKSSMTIALIVAAISSLGIAFSGHSQAGYLVEAQPMKMAAAEGIYENTGDPAPWTVVASIDTDNKETNFSLQIPYLLSFLSYGELSGEVEGMNTIQEQYTAQYGEGDYIPPVKTTFWSFRIMVGFGGLMILLSLLGLAYRKWGVPENHSFYLKFMVFMIFSPYIANTAGWIMAEMGRQPWIVQGLLQTEAAVSPNVTSGQIIFSLSAFLIIFTLLLAAMVYLFIRVIKQGPYAKQEEDVSTSDPFGKGGMEHAIK
ncbi:cytochrome ubiquinol oxidase subunit I [Oceanobacillus halophilus]|uniref:Cytochrome ubiquinol oxidase subunit I n=1 Tax=Oceanobacillus halophilus TaxID=930130 RepID=A0A495A113_9BACI|nr:cytochrome ubiquinol oxidase subunit I [Oceanobacillus halophilus]RKQ33158.1 cytochrome ubiquinol oxidase subunit I [Oceanobacillus halophilus]